MHPSCLSTMRAGDMDGLHALLEEDRTRFYGMTVKGNSILHIAASLGHVWPITEACNNFEWDLLQHQNLKGDTILHCVARAGHDHILSLLIDHQEVRQMTKMQNRRGDSALHEAARGGDVKAVRQLLAVGENMASRVNGDGESPLYLAAVRGSVETVEMLLGCALVNYRGPRGQTALHAAVCRSYASKDDVDVIKEILHHCPDATELTDGDGNNFLHVAAKKRATKVVKLVLSNPLLRQNINETDHEGNTPLHLAAMDNNIDIIRLLLSDSRVDKNVINRKGLTPFDVVSSIDDSKFLLRKIRMIRRLHYTGSKLGPHRRDIVMGKDQQRPEEELKQYITLANNLAIVAVLIATVTFAAAFTLPGGYNSDDNNQGQGVAILAKKVAFKVFLISNTIAMASSISVTCLLIFSGTRDRDIRWCIVFVAMAYMWVALGGMLVEFSTGIYVVVVSQCRWLADFICGIAFCIPFIVCLSLRYIKLILNRIDDRLVRN
ncbi:hypothetical protein M5K25_002934 [Dendrobium thyrsiflorum]|uniref:PGG domain-containing protein n=1 Tax=Dendrobium thyrsiflorum TaxID=117978 RepID=A0ABD0VPK8_DENTH